MFLRILSKSISKRKGKIIIAVVAIIMGVSIPAAMFTVSFDINSKIGLEFRKFGANLLIVPESDIIDVGIGDISLSSIKLKRLTGQEIFKDMHPFYIRSLLLQLRVKNNRLCLLVPGLTRIQH